VAIRWHKSRWYCTEPACPRTLFTEQTRQVPAGARLTRALRREAGRVVADGGRTVLQAGRDLGISWPVVQRSVEDYATEVLPDEPPVTKSGSTRPGRHARLAPEPRHGQVGAGRGRLAHQASSTPVAARALFGQVEGRNAASVAAWLNAQHAKFTPNIRSCESPREINGRRLSGKREAPQLTRSADSGQRQPRRRRGAIRRAVRRPLVGEQGMPPAPAGCGKTGARAPNPT